MPIRDVFNRGYPLSILRTLLVTFSLFSFGMIFGSVVVYVFSPSLVLQLGGGLAVKYLPHSLQLGFLLQSPRWFTQDGLFWALVAVVAVELWLGFELWLRVTGRISRVTWFFTAAMGIVPGRHRLRQHQPLRLRARGEREHPQRA